MKVIYLLILIGSTLTSSEDYSSWGWKLYDISYDTKYTVDVNQFPEKYLPANFLYYFRLSVIEDDKMQIQLTVLKRAIIQFDVRVCAYNYGKAPTDQQIYDGHSGCVFLTPKSDKTSGSYDVYLYDFETQVGVDYLGVLVRNYQALDFLEVYIYSEKGSIVLIILLAVFLPCIIIAALVIYFLRRCGVIRIGVSSNYI